MHWQLGMCTKHALASGVSRSNDPLSYNPCDTSLIPASRLLCWIQVAMALHLQQVSFMSWQLLQSHLACPAC